jgi:hypothetical protein
VSAAQFSAARAKSETPPLRALTHTPPPHTALLPPQVSTGTYDSRANRGLLRLYQLNPSRAQPTTVIPLVLAKALTALPDPDFLQAVHLVAPKHHTDLVKALIELDACLQRAQFAAFWEKANAGEARALLAKVPGFDDAIRAFIVSALSRTYASMEAEVVRTALNVQDAAAFAAQRGWAVEGSLVVLPSNPETSPRPKRTGEEEGLGLGLRLGDVGGLLQTLGKLV